MSRRQKKNLYRIIAATALFVGVVLLPFGGILKAVLFLVPYLAAGYDVLWGAVRNIISGRVFDENFLMALATVGAFIIGEYPEAVFVMLFYQVGELFQNIAVGKSRKSITDLMDIAPETAFVLRGDDFKEVFPEEVIVGDVVLVKPGEKIPVDGIVIKGASDIDTSAMTGESLPGAVMEGSEVISGCVNMTSPIQIRATKEYSDSTVAKILELVEHSAMNKGKYENFITRFARVYTPVVVLLALLVAFIPPIFTGNVTVWVLRALSFLVVSCPCALVISVPLSFFGGIGAASRRGVLIKGSGYLELLEKCGIVACDKTGTLTEGKLFVSGVEGEDTLKLAASIERFSSHPVAKAICSEIKEFYNAENVVEIPGKGMSGTVHGKLIAVGNKSLFDDMGIEAAQSKYAILVAVDNKYYGSIALSDKVKSNTADAIAAMKKEGVKSVVMLTGDNGENAEAVAEKACVDAFYHSLLPQEKVSKLEEIMAENDSTTVYLGDGINDAPVLKRADVGIAMGAVGSDAAIEASDIVFMNDDIALLPESIKIAKKTLSIVRQNIVFSIGVKVLVLVLTALGHADMWQAVFADVGVMVIAVLNTLRTLKL